MVPYLPNATATTAIETLMGEDKTSYFLGSVQVRVSSTTTDAAFEEIIDTPGTVGENEWLLMSFLHLKKGWNAGSGLPLPPGVIRRAIDILRKLSFQPEIFPTGRESVQFEYEHNQRELEIEIFEDEVDFLLIENDGSEKVWSSTNRETIYTTLDHFYADATS